MKTTSLQSRLSTASEQINLQRPPPPGLVYSINKDFIYCTMLSTRSRFCLFYSIVYSMKCDNRTERATEQFRKISKILLIFWLKHLPAVPVELPDFPRFSDYLTLQTPNNSSAFHYKQDSRWVQRHSLCLATRPTFLGWWILCRSQTFQLQKQAQNLKNINQYTEKQTIYKT